MSGKKDTGRIAYKFAQSRLVGFENNQTRHSLAKFYGAMVMYFHKLGTSEGEIIHTRKTRYGILKSMSSPKLNYLQNKSRYYKFHLKNLLDCGLLDIDFETGFILINSPIPFINENHTEGASWLPSEAVEVFERMAKFNKSGKEHELIMNFGPDMIHQYHANYRQVGHERAVRIVDITHRRTDARYNQEILGYEEKERRYRNTCILAEKTYGPLVERLESLEEQSHPG